MILISKIKIGERHRKDLGDIDALARDIEEIGLLQPIVVTSKGELIAGFRRLEAWKRTNFANQPIPTHVVDLDAIVRGEFSENMQRKNFTPSEIVAIKRSLEPLFRAAARVRQAHGGTAPGKRMKTQAPSTKGNALDQLGKVLGRDRKTIGKAEVVVTAAEDDPVKFGKHLAYMDRTGKVDGAFQAVKRTMAGETWEPPAQASPKTAFDRIVFGEPIGGYSIQRMRNAKKRCEWALRVFEYVLDNVSVPASADQALREFENEDLVLRAFKCADG